MIVFKIKKENEFLEIHKNENGCFLLFGAEEGGQRHFYEMDISESDIMDIKNGFDKHFVNGG